jgi:hypothetical protein
MSAATTPRSTVSSQRVDRQVALTYAMNFKARLTVTEWIGMVDQVQNYFPRS